MNLPAEKVAEILALPSADRAFLARQLIASLDEAVDEDAEALWANVIERRSKEIASGAVRCRPVEDVVRELRGSLHAHRNPS